MNKKVFVWLLLCLIWGSTWLFIKIGLRDLPPLWFAGLRFAISAIILWLIAAFRGSRFPQSCSEWKYISIAAILGFSINYSLLFWGEKYISSGLAAVLQAMIPVFGLILAHLFLPNEKITGRKLFGIVTGIIGVGIIFSHQLKVEGMMALAGSAALFFSAFFVASSNVLVKSKSNHIDPVVISAGQMSIGVIPIFAVAYLWEGSLFSFHWTAEAIFSLAYLILIGAVLAFALYYWLIRHMDVTKTMLISLVTPVIAVVLGMFTLEEKLTWKIVLGAILILGGVGAIVGEKILARALKSKPS